MTPPDDETLDAALTLRLIERLHAHLWSRYGERLDPALDLVDFSLDALTLLVSPPRPPFRSPPDRDPVSDPF